jgi:hypothetical protein
MSAAGFAHHAALDGNSVISNQDHGPDLPPSWDTLYQLSASTKKR